MEILATSHISITHQIKASECARLAGVLAGELQYSETRAGEASIVARELATNCANHARGGSVALQAVKNDGKGWLELFAWDKGPGIPDLAEALRDGHSTAGSLGHGLGAAQRLSNCFAIDSDLAKGTRIYSRLLPSKQQPEPEEEASRRCLIATGLSLPRLGERENGDRWAIYRDGAMVTLVVIDGLGHGPQAAEASTLALGIAEQHRREPVDELLQRMHTGLNQTRGAVGAIARINLGSRLLQYSGIGNIRALVGTPEKRHHLVSHNGTLGKQIRRIHRFELPWDANCQLIMHSDGLSQRWDAHTFFQMNRHHPGLAVAGLMNEHQKPGDDCTLLAARELAFSNSAFDPRS